MTDKKNLNEGPGLIPGLLDTGYQAAKNHLAKKRDAKAHAYANSPKGLVKENGAALTKWIKKIGADWAGYSHLHELEPTAANLAQFVRDQYQIDASNITPQATITRSPAVTQVAAPATAISPAPPQSAPAVSPPAAPVAPAVATAVAPAASAAPNNTADAIEQANKAIADPDTSREDRIAARKVIQTHLRNAKVKSSGGRANESLEIDEDLLRDEIKHIDDLPGQIGDKNFKDKSLIDTIKALGLYDQQPEAKPHKNGAPLKEADSEDIDLNAYFTNVARFILRNRDVLAATKKYDIGTLEYSKYLKFMKQQQPASGSSRNSGYGATSVQPNVNQANPAVNKAFWDSPVGRNMHGLIKQNGDNASLSKLIADAQKSPTDMTQVIQSIPRELAIRCFNAFFESLVVATTK